MTAGGLDADRIRRAARSTDDLLHFLAEDLNWPVPEGEDLVDHMIPLDLREDLHLDPASVARFDSIQQMPLLVTGQEFAVFVLSFSDGRLPTGAVKRIVNKLVRKKRTGMTTGRQAVWDLQDLLFFCQSSEGVDVVHVVAFQEKEGKPILRVAKWDTSDTDLKIEHVAATALPSLVWPDDPDDLRDWKRHWPDGFTGVREGIRTAKRLAAKMAEVAAEVRDGVRDLYDVEAETGPLRTLAAEMRTSLIDDLTPDDFADMFAETMVYGLLTARIVHPEDFAADALASAFRFDNPFLDAVYQRFRDQAGDSFDIDELGLGGLADALGDANIAEVLADFGTEGRRDDPVVHFYEDFLADYNPEKRIELGVYYTPQPVVRYIIRMVDEILKRDFGLPLGVADPTTWGELADRMDGIEVPDGVDPDRPYVSMLDPATGTGTFLVEWLALAEENVRAQARAQGAKDSDLDAVWLEALERTVLPGMAAFEITMASYAVAHLKVSLSLPEEFRGRQRLPIYLTDTLRPSKAREGAIDFDTDPISEERRLADEVKERRPVTVIVGNPPYRERARGLGGIVEAPDNGTRRSPSLDLFKEKGAGNTEFNLHNLNVYFWRWATWKALIDSGDTGIVSFITTSPYLTSPAFQGMRRWIRRYTEEAHVVDCTPEGHQPDVPTRLFPGVQQPLAILTLTSTSKKPEVANEGDRPMGEVRYRAVEGRQSDKFDQLSRLGVDGDWLPGPSRWTGPLMPAGSAIWEGAPSLPDLMPFRTTAVTANRPWPNAPHPEVLENRWARLAAADSAVRASLLKTTRDRDLEREFRPLPGFPARGPLGTEPGDCLEPVPMGWRSFDLQYLIPDSRVLDMPRPALWEVRSDDQVYVVELHSEPLREGPGLVFSGLILESSYFKGRGGRVFPLWDDAEGTVPNVRPGFLENWGEALGCSVEPDAWLEYLAGVTGYPSFQERFADDLATPGIRVPLTGSSEVYDRARAFGRLALAANTRRERGSVSDLADLVPAGDRIEPPQLIAPISDDPDAMPDAYGYDPKSRVLTIGTGSIGPVDPDVMGFTTSGMPVFRKWFNYRKKNPSGRTKEGLSGINATHWYPEWTDDLVAMLSDLTLLVEATASHRALLDDLLDGPLVTAEEALRERGGRQE